MENTQNTVSEVATDAQVLSGIQVPIKPFERFLLKPMPEIKLVVAETIMVGSAEDAAKPSREPIEGEICKYITTKPAKVRIGVVLAVPEHLGEYSQAWSNIKPGDRVVYNYSQPADLYKDSVLCYQGDILGEWVGEIPTEINKVSVEEQQRAIEDEPKIKAWQAACAEAQAANLAKLDSYAPNYENVECGGVEE